MALSWTDGLDLAKASVDVLKADGILDATGNFIPTSIQNELKAVSSGTFFARFLNLYKYAVICAK